MLAKKVLTLFTLISMVSLNSKAQDTNHWVISGKVTDAETNVPLALSHIGVKGRSIGTVSNKVGEFDFYIGQANINDTLYVSNIGYQQYLIPLNHLKSNENLIVQLIPGVVMLQEIVITDEELTALKIIKHSIDNISHNYPQHPYLLKAFYRDYQSQDSKYVSLYEAAVSLYDKGYRNPPNIERVYLEEVRRSKSINIKSNIPNRINVLAEMLRINDVRYLTNALDTKENTYERIGLETIGNRLVYVIKTNGIRENFIYIDTENYAVLKIVLNAKWDGDEKNQWIDKDSITNNLLYLKKILSFKEINGSYYPSYMNYEWKLTGTSPNEEREFTSVFFQEMMVNEIQTEDIQKPRQKRMDQSISLNQQLQKYDATFWSNYNIIKDSPLDKRIILDLENQGRLNEQFELSSKQIDQ